MPALTARNAKPLMIGDMQVVVDRMVEVVNKEGSATEVPWAMCAKFVGFMWDPMAHNFEFRYLAWIVKRDFQVRMRGSARHEYQVLANWTWQAFREVVITLELMSEFLPEVLMSKRDLVWLTRRLEDNGRETGSLFTATDAVLLLGKWMAEYSAYVRTIYWEARPEGDEGVVVKGFKDTSEAWEASLTRARARADAQYGNLVRISRTEQGPSGRGGQLLGKRALPSPGHGIYQAEGGYGLGQRVRPTTDGQRSNVGRYNRGVGDVHETRCNACLKKGHKAFERACRVVKGDILVPLHRAVPALTPDEHYWATKWRSKHGGSRLSVRGVGGGGRGRDFARRGHGWVA